MEVELKRSCRVQGSTCRQHRLPDAIRDFLQMMELHAIPHDRNDVRLRKVINQKNLLRLNRFYLKIMNTCTRNTPCESLQANTPIIPIKRNLVCHRSVASPLSISCQEQSCRSNDSDNAYSNPKQNSVAAVCMKIVHSVRVVSRQPNVILCLSKRDPCSESALSFKFDMHGTRTPIMIHGRSPRCKGYCRMSTMTRSTDTDARVGNHGEVS
jgi:hypothetical protein